jgi:hypothetical protein
MSSAKAGDGIVQGGNLTVTSNTVANPSNANGGVHQRILPEMSFDHESQAL